jgi:hypothetical protein
MNSGHPQYEQQPQRNWLEVAKRKWSGASITGSGRYSVRLMDGKNIRLFETFESAAELCSQSAAYRFTDLAQEPPAPCRTVGDAYDPDELRRERREARERLAAQAQGTS